MLHLIDDPFDRSVCLFNCVFDVSIKRIGTFGFRVVMVGGNEGVGGDDG